jgi:sugar phosphate isomerase/epimerase
MAKRKGTGSVSRRKFLATTGGLMATAPGGGPGGIDARGESPAASPLYPAAPKPPRTIPIGVFDSAFDGFSLEEMLDRISALEIEAVEIRAKGLPSSKHCPVTELLADPAKARAWKKKFEDRNIQVAAFSCHGNPIHPDPAIAARDDQFFRNGVLLAERLEVPVVVGFSGCPGGSPADKTPNWITYRWPPEVNEMLKYQWAERVIPYWQQAASFAREHGIRRIALEMHPNFVVYNPQTLIKLRDAVGEEIGANCDLSHLFWQGCDPIETIRFLGKQSALFHAHMKDTLIVKELSAQTGVLNFSENPAKATKGSVYFRAVGYGHGAQLWKDVVKAYMDGDYHGILSIENEDPILSGEVGVERAMYVLKNVRAELLAETP